jgi:hypothetical protein
MQNNTLQYKIEGKTFTTTEQYITGRELKTQGGIPLDVEMYLAIQKPFEDELIDNDARVNLARPDIEQFFVKKSLKFFINEIQYTSYKQWISGEELRLKGNVSPDYDLYLKVDEGWQDNLIDLKELIDLAMPGKEGFYTKKGNVEPTKVKIHIDDNPYDILPGNHSVSELKLIGGVTNSKELDQVLNGVLSPLKNDASVIIKGGESFFSRMPDGVSA